MVSLKVAVTGTTGFLGSHLVSQALKRKFEVLSLARSSHPSFKSQAGFSEIVSPQIVDLNLLGQSLRNHRPNCVLHLAAESSPQKCEEMPDLCQISNIKYSQLLMEICQELRIPFYFVSSDLVFEAARAPMNGFLESAEPCPVSNYAKSKSKIEAEVLGMSSVSGVLRTCLMFGNPLLGSGGSDSWLHSKFRDPSPNKIHLFCDEWRTPVYVGDVANVLCELAAKKVEGVFHAAGPERLTREELGRLFASYHGYPADLIEPVSRKSGNPNPPRAEDVSLNADHTKSVLGVRFQAPSSHYMK